MHTCPHCSQRTAAFDEFDTLDQADEAIPPLPPGNASPPASPLEHAQRMLQRAIRGREVNEQRLRRAAQRNQWPQASQHAGRAIAAERAVTRWNMILQRLQNSRGPYR